MSTKNAEAVLLVKFLSRHDPELLLRICIEDLEKFRKFPGLLQKYYVTENSTGAISGFYIFDSEESRSAFWKSELAAEIPERYGVVPDSLRVEQFEMAIVLNDVILA